MIGVFRPLNNLCEAPPLWSHTKDLKIGSYGTESKVKYMNDWTSGGCRQTAHHSWEEEFEGVGIELIDRT
jgi:hypothetical protein